MELLLSAILLSTLCLVSGGIVLVRARVRSRNRASAAAIRLEGAATRLPESSPAFGVFAASVELATQDAGATNMQAAIPSLWPKNGATTLDSADALTSVERLLAELEQHSLAVAGMEQLALAAFNSTVPDALAMPEALQHLAGIPADLQVGLGELSSYLHGPQLTADLAPAMHELALDAVRHLFPSIGPMGLDLGLGVHVLEAISDHSFAPLGPWALGEAAHGLHLVAEQALQSSPVIDAVQHFAHAAQAAEGVAGVDSVVGHFPWITLALSSVREVRLLDAGKTDPGSAARNIALDVTGTGGGALVGFKVGALAGTAVAPGVGSLIGGLVGAVGGAIGGRALSNDVKQRRLREALEAFEQRKQALPGLRDAAAGTLEQAVRGKTNLARAAFLDAVPPAPTVSTDDPDTLRSLVGELRIATATYLDDVERLLRAATPARGGAAHAQRFEHLAGAAEKTRAELTAIEGAAVPDPLRVLATLGAHGLPTARDVGWGEEYTLTCERVRTALVLLAGGHRERVVDWTRQTVATFHDHTQRLTATIKPDIDVFADTQGRLHDELETAAATVRKEADKLGK